VSTSLPNFQQGGAQEQDVRQAKIYYLNQDQLPAPSEEERAQVEVRIKELEGECTQVEQELRASEAALASVNSQISDADLEVKLRELSEETQTLAAKLETLERPDLAPVSPGRKDKLKKRFTTLRVRLS
jgi:septal ring factor EnvC (AmiA/AmiB activator)